jgi:gliding motility-associated-like protein
MLITCKRHWAVLLFVTFVSIKGLIAQNQTNNYGKEFRFAFLENYGTFEKVSFVVSSEKAHFTLRIYCAAYSDTFNIFGKDTILNYLKAGVPSASLFNPARSILITATEDISVFALNNSLNSSDISAITPTERVPSNPVYYINTYRGDESIGKANNSLFSVLALDDSCVINILPSCDSKNNLFKNIVYTRLLRKGQVYQEQALDSQSFAGTKIWNSKGCKKFVVFEGAKCSFVEYNNAACKGCDHLYNQTRPLQYLGKSFTTVPFETNSGGYLFQVVATENATTVSINNIPVKVLNEGESYLVNQSNNLSVCISSDKPISVIELMKSGECNGQSSNLGNPSLMSVIPDDQTSKQAGFSFPNTSNISQNPSFPAEYYVTIVSITGKLGNIKLNNVKLDTAKFKSVCKMSVASFKLNAVSKNHISSPDGFIAYMYAIGKDESYASEIGSSYENRSTELLLEANKTNVCDTQHLFTFNAQSDSAATYRWNFGDGSTGTGSPVTKSYNQSGLFRLALSVTYPNNFGCKQDSIIKLIKVNSQPVFSLGKDTNLCQGVYYELAPIVRPKSTFNWWNGSKASITTISNNTKAWLTVTDTNMCQFSDTVTIRFVNCDTNSIQIPNVFTPVSSGTTADNVNDYFETKYSGFDQVKGYIYNRWGELVYQLNIPSTQYWNGYVDNDISRPCPAGTYYYVYQYINTQTGLTKDVNGVVQLIR